MGPEPLQDFQVAARCNGAEQIRAPREEWVMGTEPLQDFEMAMNRRPLTSEPVQRARRIGPRDRRIKCLEPLQDFEAAVSRSCDIKLHGPPGVIMLRQRDQPG